MRALLLAVLVPTAVVALAARAIAGCPDFPSDVPGWQGLTHAAVVRYVDSKFDGDWQHYEDALIKSLNAVTDIRKAGGTAVVGGGRRLEGAALDHYIERLAERIGITRCLARTPKLQMAAAQAGAADDSRTSQMASFETAAGGNSTPTAPATRSRPATETAAVTATRTLANDGTDVPLGGDQLHVAINTRCGQDQGILRIYNSGKAWPKVAQLVIRNADANSAKPVAVRVLRMVEGQTATFYVDPKQTLNVSIKPTWAGGTEALREIAPSCAR